MENNKKDAEALEQLQNAASQNGKELTDEELDNVSGGSNSIELPLHCRQCGSSSFGLCLKEISENVATLCWICANCGKLLDPDQTIAQR